MRLVLAILLTSVLMPGCRGTTEQPSPASDPTDFFFRWEGNVGAEYPPIRLHERKPGRLFATTLRPTMMTGAFPTAYLSRITRTYQPWAERIYDVAYGGFDLKEMSPTAPEKGLGPYNLAGREIQIEIGGWSRSGDPHPRWLGRIYKGHLETGQHDVFVADDGWTYHHFRTPETGNLDGQPVTMKCGKVVGCTAELTIPQEIARLPAMQDGGSSGRSTGARLAVSFRSELVGDWAEIRRKAACFASFSIPALDRDRVAPLKGLRCDDVDKAITKTLATR